MMGLRRMMMSGASSSPPVGEGTVWDPETKTSLVIISNGGRRVHRAGAGIAQASPRAVIRATVGHAAGNWYNEITSPQPSYGGDAYESAGVITAATPVNESLYVGLPTNTWGFCFRRTAGGSGVQEVKNGVGRWVSPTLPIITPGWIGIALDASTGAAWAIINGGWAFWDTPLTRPAGRFSFPAGTTMFPAISLGSGIDSAPNAHYTINTGQAPFNIPSTAFAHGGALEGFTQGW